MQIAPHAIGEPQARRASAKGTWLVEQRLELTQGRGVYLIANSDFVHAAGAVAEAQGLAERLLHVGSAPLKPPWRLQRA